jgi:HEPN domain-containing protein
MTKNEKIAYWKDISNYDLETSKTMLSGGRYLYVGFMCHQAVEKILKALYTKIKEETPPSIHNLKILANACELYNDFSDKQKDLIDELIPLNIEARYPTYMEKLMKQFGKEKCEILLFQTTELCRWIEKKL